MDYSKIILRPVIEVDDETLAKFDCGVPDLNGFLLTESKPYASHGITFTTVVFIHDDPLQPIGYFSLSADSIRLSIVEQGDLDLPFHAPIPFYPAVKITKLAVHKDCQSRGIGEMLINLIEGLAFDGQTAVRLLNVNAINNERTIAFYEKVRFLRNLDAQERKNNDHPGKRRKGKPAAEATVLMHRDIYADPNASDSR